ALADLGRNRPCKQPKGQALFFLVDDGYPEMLSALGAEEGRDLFERTILEPYVGIGLVNAVHIQSFDETRPILLGRDQVRATGRAAHREQTRIAPARLAIPIVFPRHVAHACTLVSHVMRCTAAVVLNVRRRNAPPRGAEAPLAFVGASGRG